MNLDFYEISDGINNIKIYPLLKFNEDNKDYLIYTKDDNNLYIGQVTNDSLIPIKEDISKFETYLQKAIQKLKNNQ